MSLHITLPSNASHIEFPDNVNGDYRIRLKHPLTLEPGEWEVGLTSIQYSRNWINVPRSSILIHNGGESFADLAGFNPRLLESTGIHGRNVKSIKELIKVLNGRMARSNSGKAVKFTLDETNNRVTVTLWNRIEKGQEEAAEAAADAYPNDVYKRIRAAAGYAPDVRVKGVGYIMLAPQLAKILGLPSGRLMRTVTGARPASLGAFSSMYIYSDIIQEVPVGNTLAPLLSVIPVARDGAYEVVHKEILHVRFHEVRGSVVQDIHVKIADDVGKTVVFDGGFVVISLELRRRRRV